MRYRVVQCDCGYTATEPMSMSCFICPQCGNRDCHPHVIREFDADENAVTAKPKLKRVYHPTDEEMKDLAELTKRHEGFEALLQTPKATTKPDLKAYGPKGIRNIRKD